MNENNPVSKAIEKLGLQPMAKAFGLSYQAIRKWEKNGMPRTEWTGETDHASRIEVLTGGEVSRSELLEWTRQLKAAA